MKEKKRKPIDNSAPIVPSPSGPSRPSGPSSPSGSKSPSPSAFQEYCFDYFEDSQGDWYTSEEYWSALHQRARFEGGLLDRIDRYLSTLQDEVVADADYLVDHPIDYTKDACEWIKDIAIEAADYAADLACDVADSAIYAVTDFPGFTKAALSDAKYYAGVISEDYMELQGEVMQDVKDCADEFSDFVDDIADEIENLDVKAEVESAAHNYVKIVDGMVSQAARGAKNYITFQRNLCGAVEECADDFARDYINFQEIHFQDLKNSLRNYVSFGRTSAQDMLKAMQDFFALQRSLFNLFFFGVVPTWDGGSLCADVPTEEEWCEEEEKEREEEKKKAEKNSRDLASVAASGMGGGRGGGGGGICP